MVECDQAESPDATHDIGMVRVVTTTEALAETLTRVQRIERTLANLEKRIMATLADLKSAVERDTTVTQSAITLLQGLSAKLQEAIQSGDPAKLQELKDGIDANTDALAAAVAAVPSG
jgi:hypothetical protein